MGKIQFTFRILGQKWQKFELTINELNFLTTKILTRILFWLSVLFFKAFKFPEDNIFSHSTKVTLCDKSFVTLRIVIRSTFPLAWFLCPVSTTRCWYDLRATRNSPSRLSSPNGDTKMHYFRSWFWNLCEVGINPNSRNCKNEWK